MIEKVYLPPTFNHDECQNVYDECKKILNDGKDLVFEGSQIERVGTAGVQILLAAAFFCQKNDRKCVIEVPSQALLETFQQLGCISIVKELGIIP